MGLLEHLEITLVDSRLQFRVFIIFCFPHLTILTIVKCRRCGSQACGIRNDVGHKLAVASTENGS
jgi:hypothetical protein